MKSLLYAFTRKVRLLLASLLVILFTFIVCVVFIACYRKDYSITVKPNHLVFRAEEKYGYGLVEYVEIDTEGEWFVSKVEPYVSVNPKNSRYQSRMTVVAAPNDSPTPRQSIIIIQSFDEPENTATISVYQERKNYEK